MGLLNWDLNPVTPLALLDGMHHSLNFADEREKCRKDIDRIRLELQINKLLLVSLLNVELCVVKPSILLGCILNIISSEEMLLDVHVHQCRYFPVTEVLQ